jgi:hypothetical protein
MAKLIDDTSNACAAIGVGRGFGEGWAGFRIVAISQFEAGLKRPELHLEPFCGGSPFNTGEMVNSPGGRKIRDCGRLRAGGPERRGRRPAAALRPASALPHAYLTARNTTTVISSCCTAPARCLSTARINRSHTSWADAPCNRPIEIDPSRYYRKGKGAVSAPSRSSWKRIFIQSPTQNRSLGFSGRGPRSCLKPLCCQQARPWG